MGKQVRGRDVKTAVEDGGAIIADRLVDLLCHVPDLRERTLLAERGDAPGHDFHRDKSPVGQPGSHIGQRLDISGLESCNSRIVMEAPEPEKARLHGRPREHDRGFTVATSNRAPGLALQPQQPEKGKLGGVEAGGVQSGPWLTDDQPAGTETDAAAADQVGAWEQAAHE
jgi:hypothetical protein